MPRILLLARIRKKYTTTTTQSSGHDEGIQNKKANIGWQHFIRGRIIIEWGLSSTTIYRNSNVILSMPNNGDQSYYQSTGNRYSNYGITEIKKCMVKHQRRQK
jgi:hypothetical protein